MKECQHKAIEISHRYDESFCFCINCGKLMDFLNLRKFRNDFQKKWNDNNG